jgi:hypothetical protein
MRVNSANSNSVLSVKSLRELSAPEMLFMHKPDNKLRNLSMFIDNIPYIKRALRISSAKNSLRAKTMISQNLNCAICEKTLLNLESMNALAKLNEEIIISDTIDDFNGGNINSLEITNSFLAKYSENS